ncbi:MAG: ROK family protein [Planctomycetales bacterium]|nr:ROK family protein [Planctomycetales bacterium]
MLLGIEIGGTKLQLGVGPGDGTLVAEPIRFAVDRDAGAAGIRRQIEIAGRELVARYGVSSVGVGFGGPVDAAAGRTITSHQIAGWDDFPLVDWCRQTLGVARCTLGNDADLAALAEARFGAGRGRDPVFYVTVGTGIGGGFVRGGKLYAGHGPAAAEIGHLRPGLDAVNSKDTVESIASGLAIERAAEHLRDDEVFVTLQPAKITAKELAWAASRGHAPSQAILDRAINTLGWALAQMITLLAPQAVVVGGGVPLLGEEPFYAPLRLAVARYVFPPLAGSYEILPPALGEAMVVHGALALTAEST